MNGAEAAPDDAVGALLSDDLRPDLDSYGCLFLSARMHEPAAVRQQFLKLSLRVHPDRNGGSTAAFQKLSTAFEILYDRDGQARHLAALRLRIVRNLHPFRHGEILVGLVESAGDDVAQDGVEQQLCRFAGVAQHRQTCGGATHTHSGDVWA